MRAVHCNWLYKVRSLEKFLRVVQKIPINLSGVKVEELRDAATVRRKYQASQKAQGTNCKMAKTRRPDSQRRYTSKIAKQHRCNEGITSGEVTVRHSPLVSPLVSIIIIFFSFFGSKSFGKGAARARA